MSDLEEACRLADALPEVAIVAGPPVRADGVNIVDALARTLASTSKHVLATELTTAPEAEAAARLGAAVAGPGRRPPLSLCAGPEGRGAVLAAARRGLVTGLVLPLEGSGKGLAAALVRHHAGVLAGCAAVQAAAPGAPFLYVAVPARAGLPSAGPEATLFQIAATQLASRLGLPAVLGGLATSSHEPDWQACTQDAFAALSGTAAAAAVTAGAGTLSGGGAFSPEQLVLDTEIFSWTAMIARGVAVDQDTVALAVIEDVGIGGNYLSQRHTRRHMRDVWRPRVLDRSMWDAWVAAGREDACRKAGQLAARLLGDHQALPLPDEVRARLARIVAEAGL